MFGGARLRPVSRAQQGATVSRPAPVGGWNARDALAEMPPTDAVTLVNWFPTPSLCEMRQGRTAFETGLPAAVETVAGYQGATPKLFAASSTAIYDVTAGGAVGAAVQSGLTNARWQYFNFTTTGGVRYLIMVNGADKPRYWDGAAWIAVDGVSAPAITGLTTTEISYATEHKSRIWLIRKNTLELYYLPVGAAGGAVALFDLRPIFKRGGKLVAAETWSADLGRGLDDHFVIATDQGEIAVYAGTDPTAAATWSLIGVYYVGGSVVGSRPMCRFGGDLLVIAQIGLLPISQLLRSTVISTKQTLTDKIQFAIGSATALYSANFGWQCAYFEVASMLLLNVPISATTFEQYVMNTQTGAWCRFTGWNSSCWEVYNDGLYFGGSTSVSKAWNGYDDAGANITTDLKTAFDYFGAPGHLKQFTMCRPIIASDGNPGVTFGLNLDFEDTDVAAQPSFAPLTSSLWDTATWESAIWNGGMLAISKGWQYLSGLGYAAAFRMKTSSRGIQVQLSAIDYLFERGGVL
jgi:hypothetical protein